MADRSSTTSAGIPPEFRIVVRHPGQRGPLGPYRLAMAVGIVLLVFGSTLWSMISSGNPDDGVLLRAAIVGLIVWVTSGVVDSALAEADSAVSSSNDNG